jgi:hypothetical protein
MSNSERFIWVYNFKGGFCGSYPAAPVTLDSAGNIYANGTEGLSAEATPDANLVRSHTTTRDTKPPGVQAVLPWIRAVNGSAVLAFTSRRGWFTPRAASCTYDRKNSFASGIHSGFGISAAMLSTATPPSWA